MEITQYEIDERKLVQLEITNKIDELLNDSSVSYLNAKIGLNLIKTFIKFMDEE